MDTKTICEIVAWITAHEDDAEAFDNDTFSGGSPAQIFFEFCSNYDSIHPYPKDQEEKATDEGCRFIYWSGPSCNLACGATKAVGSNHCPFHNQIVFSERVLNYLKDEHKKINRAFAGSSASSDEEGDDSQESAMDQALLETSASSDEDSPESVMDRPSEVVQRIHVRTTSIPGRFREMEKGLLIELSWRPNDYICIGYSQSYDSPLLPLTTYLKDYCKTIGLSYRE